MGDGCLEGTLKSELQVAAFSGIKLGWEPLLEPWPARLQFAAPTATPSPQHHRLSISSAAGLELTLTQTALEAAALASGPLAAAAAVAEDPSALDVQLEAAGAEAAYSATYWLHNQTGSTLEVWLAAADADDGAVAGGGCGLHCDSPSSSRACGSSATASGGKGPWVPSGRPELLVRPGSRVALPVVAASSARRQGLHVGAPCPVQGVSLPPQPPHSTSMSAFGTAGSGVRAAALQTRPLLFFRLAEQADICGSICGPLHLDRWVLVLVEECGCRRCGCVS